jgi:hypothetical protein
VSGSALLLPAAVWALLVLVVPGTLGLAAAAARATLLSAGIADVLTEGLSWGRALHPGPVVLSWTIVLALLTLVAVKRRGTGRLDPAWWGGRAVGWRGTLPTIRKDPLIILMIATILVVVVVTGITAAAAAPNNWDSMTYHLPRVMHWAADGDVNHYPTVIDPQLYNGPFKEYLLLHLYLISGSLGLFNLVQWCSLLVTGLGCWLVAGELGATRRGRLAAVFVAVSTPMAILQASSTQTDLTEAAFVLLLIHEVLVGRRQGLGRPGRAALVGLAMALVVLTKSTGLIFAAAVVLLWFTGRRGPLGRTLLSAAVAVLVFAGLNAPVVARNLASWGSPVGPPSARALVNDHVSVRFAVVNVARLVGSEATTPWPSVNQWMVGGVEALGRLLAVGARDSGSLVGNGPYALPWQLHEDLASAPLQVLLILAAVLLLVRRRRSIPRLPILYAVTILLAFACFAGCLRWQLWVNRLDLPLVLAWPPVVGLLFASWRRWVAATLAACLAVWTVPYLVIDRSRPLIGPGSILTTSREVGLFGNNEVLLDPYRGAAQLIRASGARTVGLAIGSQDAWEYPLWALTGGPLRGPQFVGVLPDRATAGHGSDDHVGDPAGYQALVCVELPVTTCATEVPDAWLITALGYDVTVALPPGVLPPTALPAQAGTRRAADARNGPPPPVTGRLPTKVGDGTSG